MGFPSSQLTRIGGQAHARVCQGTFCQVMEGKGVPWIMHHSVWLCPMITRGTGSFRLPSIVGGAAPVTISLFIWWAHLA